MNILLDAYFDRNYGDDIFVETITGMFPGCKFYSFLEYYPQQICNWAEQIPNLYLLPECNVFLQKNMFDAYLCVGGDIFPDKGDYSKRKAYVDSVKQGNGIVAFLGFSLFHEYCEETQRDIAELMKKADIVAPRDDASVTVLQQIIPEKEVRSMADLAFSSVWPIRYTGAQSGILGISVRRPNYADDAVMADYCKELGAVITDYLQGDEKRKVRMFSLSDGSSADVQVVEEILKALPNPERVEHLVYDGNCAETKATIGECDLMLCTRLHAMISCIAMKVPFMPIVYEVKMEHILKEIGYKGAQFSFGSLQGMREAFRDFTESVNGSKQGIFWEEESVAEYLGRSGEVLEKLNGLLGQKKDAVAVVKQDASGAVCAEKEYGKAQAKEVEKKNTELKEMADKMKEQQASIEECQNTISGYLKTIEEINQSNAEYFKLIEQLNQNIGTLSGEKEQLLQEKVQLIQERDSREEMLQRIKPFFISRTGSTLTKMTSSLVRSEEVKTNWAVIQEYFADEKTTE